ncbi:MAG: DUF1844 domain-containing protein [Phycisphaerales bacterium]|nr:DUF1844 domain-containing protein [Phycisphaerales bacterium]
MPDPDQPKIIVDSDWKSQAQAEKDRLAEQERARAAAAPPRPAPGADPHAEPEGPICFDDLVRLLATQALMYLGAYPDPQTGRAMVALDVAKVHVDLLGVLEDKTRGNLNEAEQKLLAGVLYELRMQFAEVAKALEKAVREGRISPSQASQAGAGPTMPPPPVS